MGWLVDRRRAHLVAQPAPAAWGEILERNVGVIAILDDAERARLGQLVQIFLAEKRFEGCGGLEITDEIRVTIAGMACAMLVGHDHDLLAELDAVLVYPTTLCQRHRAIARWLGALARVRRGAGGQLLQACR